MLVQNLFHQMDPNVMKQLIICIQDHYHNRNSEINIITKVVLCSLTEKLIVITRKYLLMMFNIMLIPH